MTLTLHDLLDLLQRATSPADVFGALSADPLPTLKRRYRELIALAHPDRNPDQAAIAHEASTKLQAWYEAAQREVARDAYGAKPRISAVTRLHQYVGYEAPLHGDLCDLFPVDADGELVFLKVARKARNNDLLQVEAQTLRRIDRDLEGQPVRAHFPALVESFLLRDAEGMQRHTNVVRAETDYVSLADVLRAYPAGLHPADAAWMFNRLLAALGVIHSLGIVHGAVLPPHVLIRPSDHNGMLIDWCYSVPIGAALQAISMPYAADYPPEVNARLPATPATDLYLAAGCMVRLLGGDHATAELPPSVPKPIRLLLRACLIPAPQRRAVDAWQVFEDFQTILGDLYGPRTFRPFHMPVLA